MDIMSGRSDVAIPPPGLTSHMRAALLTGFRATIASAEAELRCLRHNPLRSGHDHFDRAARMRRLVARIATAEADMAEMEEIV